MTPASRARFHSARPGRSSVAAERSGVEALPPFSRLTDYYSDATYQTDVGWHFRSCSGASDSEGSTSAFWVREFDYSCVGSNHCCIVCSTGPCPANVLAAYPCGQC